MIKRKEPKVNVKRVFLNEIKIEEYIEQQILVILSKK